MNIYSQTIKCPMNLDRDFSYSRFLEMVGKDIQNSEGLVRLVFSGDGQDQAFLNISGFEKGKGKENLNLLKFRKREVELFQKMNVAMIVPTGVGAEIGGHAGDAGPSAKLLGQVCDNLILHPNVVNASDINEMPENALYVEGSTLTRLFNGTIGLQKPRSNRILMIAGPQESSILSRITLNALDAARATYGLNCVGLEIVSEDFLLKGQYDYHGMATGEVLGLEKVVEVLERRNGEFDAVSITSFVKVEDGLADRYFNSRGEIINPWGAVEAIFTHGLSLLTNFPAAHSPMARNFDDFGNCDLGYVDPRMSSEAISLSFFQCTLKGLMKSPRILDPTPEVRLSQDILTVENISCLVTPDNCVGQPLLAAIEQEIPVIAVRSNKTIMNHKLDNLPFKKGTLIYVDSYLEACGAIKALESGISIESIRRPLCNVERVPKLNV